MSSQIFGRISAFVGQLPDLTYHEASYGVDEHGSSINSDVVMAYMLAHTATIRLYAASLFIDDHQNRTNAALAIAQLASVLNGVEVRSQSQALMASLPQFHMWGLMLNIPFHRGVVLRRSKS